MSSIVISGDVSGAATISAPSAAGTPTLTLPTTSGTLLTTASTTGVNGSAISSGTVAEAYGGTGSNYGWNDFKNRIINGAMVISQRNGTSSVNNVTTYASAYVLDRWNMVGTQASKFTIQQNAGSVTPPIGFSNYLGVTSSSAYSVLSSDYFCCSQSIEGYNIADLAWGTANAKTITLSFQVYSSLTGTFGGVLQNSAGNRTYPFTYTISSANTWTSISVTIAGDTTGTWVTNNGSGIFLNFSLGTGSTYSASAGTWSAGNYLSATGAISVVGTSGATFYITGVQLEKGSTATSFDYRPYGTELALCQRYCQAVSNYSLGVSSYTNIPASPVQLRVTMRAAPTLSSGASFAVDGGSAGTPALSATTGGTSNPDSVFVINSANNWSVGNRTSFTGILTAEL
jgi:hypothetical protein